MPAQTRAVLKGYFERGDRPTSAQFSDVMDSFALVGAGANSLSIASAASGLVRASAQTGSARGVELGAGWTALLSAATTVLRVRALGAGAVGSALFNAATTAAAQATLNLGTHRALHIGADSIVCAAGAIGSPADGGIHIAYPTAGNFNNAILPASPSSGQRAVFVHKGNAGRTVNIRACGAGNTIEGASAKLLSNRDDMVELIFTPTGSAWRATTLVTHSGGAGTAAAATTAQASAGTNVSAALTPGRARFLPWAAKAWAVFQGSALTGTNCTIMDRFNVASVCGGPSNGMFRINWGSAFPNRNYALFAQMHQQAVSIHRVAVPASVGSQQTTDVLIQSVDNNDAFVAVNPTVSHISVVAFSR